MFNDHMRVTVNIEDVLAGISAQLGVHPHRGLPLRISPTLE